MRLKFAFKFLRWYTFPSVRTESSSEEASLKPSFKPEVVLRLRADMTFLPLATAFAEKSAIAFGLEEPEALSLTLAVEEIFVYLSRTACPGGEVRIYSRGGGYFVEIEFLFPAEDFDMKSFNITTKASLDPDADFSETGLLIASRMVEQFRFEEIEQKLRLTLTKAKTYPDHCVPDLPPASPLKGFSIKEAVDPEELKLLVRRINTECAGQVFPEICRAPGLMVDIVAAGDYKVALAVDKMGHIGGGIIWKWEGTGLIECFGPYLFGQPADSTMGSALLDSCIADIARTGAKGLINRFPTPDLPKEYFEPLGSLTFQAGDGEAAELVAYYRHLEEDLGGTVWSHPLLEGFLQHQYRKLFFAREILPVKRAGESCSPFSVLSAEFDRGRNRVTLRPVWWGEDAHFCLADHVETLRRELISSIFFEMDVGKSWQCHFTPALVENGFQPRLILPYAGKGDLVIFQLTTGESRS